MVGGDLCGSPIIPNAPCRRGLRPLVPRGRRSKEGAQGAKSQAVSPSPPQCSFCPVADASFILQAPRLQGRVAGQGPGLLGSARRSSEGRGRAARRGCPAFPPSDSSRRSPAAGPKGWLGFPAKLGRPGLRAAPWLPRHRPGVRPRTQLSHTHARPHPPSLSAALGDPLSWSLSPGCAAPSRPPQAVPRGEAGCWTRAGAGRGEGPAVGECLAAPAPRVSDWARRSPPSLPLPFSRSPPSLARSPPAPACSLPTPTGTFRAAAAASFTL